MAIHVTTDKNVEDYKMKGAAGPTLSRLQERR